MNKKCFVCGKTLTNFEKEAGWFKLIECPEIAEVYCEKDHLISEGKCLDKNPLCENCHIKDCEENE